MAVVTVSLVSTNNRRAAIEIDVERTTNEVLTVRVANLSQKNFQVRVGDASRLAINGPLVSGTDPRDFTMNPPLSYDTLYFSMTG